KNLRNLVENYPADIITTQDVCEVLHGKDCRLDAGDKHLLAAMGLTYHGGNPLWVRGKTQRVWILRNASKWKDATNRDLSEEANAATFRAGVDVNATVNDILAAVGANK
ncbi:TPA: hypothetical protein ACWX8N_004796, partial [Escherichia coli]